MRCVGVCRKCVGCGQKARQQRYDYCYNAYECRLFHVYLTSSADILLHGGKRVKPIFPVAAVAVERVHVDMPVNSCDVTTVSVLPQLPLQIVFGCGECAHPQRKLSWLTLEIAFEAILVCIYDQRIAVESYVVCHFAQTGKHGIDRFIVGISPFLDIDSYRQVNLASFY